MTTQTQEKKVRVQEAKDRLLTLLSPTDTVYTILRTVSKSGMSRGIDLYVIQDSQPIWITGSVAIVLKQSYSQKRWSEQKGLLVEGCGMDMGFHIVSSLSYALFGYQQDKQLSQKWL